MVYSSPEPQFVCVSAILKEEKITLQQLGREAVNDISYKLHRRVFPTSGVRGT